MRLKLKFAFLLCIALSVTPVFATETVLSFTGSDSYVNIGTPAALQIPSNNPFTIEGWMLFNSLDIRDTLYCKNNGRGGPYTYMVGFINSGVMAAHNGSAWIQPTSSASAVPGQWFHLSFSFDGSIMSFYLDGELLGTKAFSFINTEAHTVKIGGYDSSADINGMMSDVRVWNYARSQVEIQASMSNRLSGVESGLIGYWPINEGTGTVVFDCTKNRCHGEIIGAGWGSNAALSDIFPAVDFIVAPAFILADKQTADTDFTNSNEVDIVDFPVPEGFDRYQLTEDGDISSIDPVGWIATGSPPSELSFVEPGADQDIIRYAWFTNSLDSVLLRRAGASIRYTTALPLPAVKATYSRGKAPGQDVVVYPWEIDDGSTGGTTGGEEIPIHSLHLRVESGPGADATPEEPFVTVSELGTYQITLTVTNAAGSAATSIAGELTVEMIESNTILWEGNVDSNWFNPANWDLNTVPFDGTEVIVNDGADVFLNTPSAELASFEMNGGTLTFDGWSTWLSAETIAVRTGTVTHVQNSDPAEPWEPNARVYFICSDFLLQTGATINVTAKGYLGGDPGGGDGKGPGGGGLLDSRAGGGYGGYGATTESYMSRPNALPYGNPAAPEDPGSGGASAASGSGGPGGGVVRIQATNNAVINGAILADGRNYSGNHNAGGSGGSVYISCERFFGSNSVISAHGGNGLTYGYAGGGGRIAISYNTSEQLTEWISSMRFDTSPGLNGVADIGSLWLPDTRLLESEEPELFAQIYNVSSWTVDNLTITNSWLRFREPGFTLNVLGDLIVSGAVARLDLGGTIVTNIYRAHYFGATAPLVLNVNSNMNLLDGGVFNIMSGATNGTTVKWGGYVDVLGDLTISSNSVLYTHSEPTNGGSVFFTVKNLNVEEGGIFSAEGLGYLGAHAGVGYGPGHGCGAGYGGQGGHTPVGMPYGVMERPEHPGSGGNGSVYGRGGHGGGFIRVRARNTVRVDGTISANGVDREGNHNSGGSGGGIFIECLKFEGAASGILSANGSDGYSSANSNNGGGGGGRIAIWTGDLYTEITPPHRVSSSGTPPSLFEGSVTVDGGLGVGSTGRDGDPGTMIFFHILFPSGTFFGSF